MVFNLSEQHSIANEFLLAMRDKDLQQDRMRFRKNMERLGEIMAYELSRKLSYRQQTVATPLGKTTVHVLEQQPVLLTILRAGFPYFQGFLNFFDKADAGFIGAYRQEAADDVTIKLEYAALPKVEGQDVIMVDPMLATGRSMMDSLETILKKWGTPRHIHLVSLVAAPEGIRYITANLKHPHSIWTCAVDSHLDERFYIVPGLGDAGDLSFGLKL